MKNHILYTAFSSLLLISCGGSSNNVTSGLTKSDTLTVASSPISPVAWYQPPLNVTWQWQLLVNASNTTINTSYNVDVYDIDLFDVSSA